MRPFHDHAGRRVSFLCKRYLWPGALLGILIYGASCKKVIQVPLDNASPQIVIEGEVTNMPGPFHVSISKTVSFSTDNNFPPVTGATVTIRDSSLGLVFPLTEVTPGHYFTDTVIGQTGHTYLLSVLAEGQSFTASSTMPAAIPIDSISFVKNYDLNNKSAINAVVNFQDPPGIHNYYQFMEYDNDIQVPGYFLLDGLLTDGRYVRETLYNDTSYLRVGDNLQVSMYCVEANIYNYFVALFMDAGSGFQSTTPANPYSNISQGALGYFSAHTVSSKFLQVY